MQQLLERKPADAQKKSHRLVVKEPSPQNPPPYADNNSTLPQILEMQQHFHP